MPGARAVVALVAMLALPLSSGGCGRPVKTIMVDMLAFGPAPAGLRVGDTVEWRNPGVLEHSATADDAGFDVDLPAGGAGRTRLREAGVIRYYCRFHPGMTGELRVAE